MRRYATTGLLLFCALLFSACVASSASASGAPGADAWGGNSAGQLGDGTTANSLSPTPVSGLSGILQIAGAKDHALALLSSGKVMAWGENKSGQLGNATTTASDVPVEVKGITDAVAVAAGNEFSLALLEGGTVVAWGLNAEGQLGDGGINNADTPQAVHELSGVQAIAAGAKHALALLTSGEVKAWGADSAGQLGDGSTEHGEVTPVLVHELSGATAIAAGGNTSLAVVSAGEVEAWGNNNKGQLGNGTTTSSDLPVHVKGGLAGVTQLAGGESHELAVTSAGAVYAWGDGSSGDLGQGSETSAEEPIAAELSEASAVAAGANFSLALLRDGNVAAWGADHEGELGNGTTSSTGSDVPLTLTAIHEVQAIGAGTVSAYAAGPELPTVTALHPASGPAGGGTSVTITGSGFSGVKAVQFGATAATTYTVDTETEITATAPAGTGAVNVTVTITGGTSAAAAANSFSYAPVLTGISPDSGPQSGGTEVVISGMNLEGVTGVAFGKNSAMSFKDESDTKVVAFSPAGVGAVAVTLTGPGGTSETIPADEFFYESAAPELGRCLKTKKHRFGTYLNKGCTVSSTEGHFEWKPGANPTHSKFKIRSEAMTLQVPNGKDVVCLRGKGSGEYSGARSLSKVVFELRECELGTVKCKSPSAAKEGEIDSTQLAGELGVIETLEPQTEDEIGIDFSPAGAGPLFEFTCEGKLQVWRGSVIVPVTANEMQKTVMLSFLSSSGHQEVEAFEGRAKDVLESSIAGGAYEQSALNGTLELAGKEIEVSSVH